MNITKVAAWSEIVSSIAVLATLVYLGLQMQQNTAAIHAQTRQAMVDGDQRSLHVLLTHPGVWLDWATDRELSSERKIRLHAHLVSIMRFREYQWFQYQNGVLDETAWRSYRSVIPLALGTERNRKWWAEAGRMGFDPGFVNMVDGMVAGQPYTDYLDKILAMD